jgi:4-amino-4-deoxy-L-arabinose transferase-like glycosyltransferase
MKNKLSFWSACPPAWREAIESIKYFVKNNKKEFYILVFILAVAAFFRLYRIGEYMTFLGDEGRDAIIVRRLLVDFDPILIGPGTSIGNMYLGPLYYYFIAPSLLLANFSPVGPSAAIALTGIATVFLVWFVAREWFGKSAAGIAALLYAISPTTIIFSKSSWNPNIMPFFALLSIYSIWRLWQYHEQKWLYVAAVSMAFVMQSHYLGLILIPVLGIFWLLTIWNIKKDNLSPKYYIQNTIYSALLFAGLMSPLVIFDFRHNFINWNAMKVFFTERQTTVSARPWNALPNVWPLWEDITTRLLAGRHVEAGKWFALVLMAGPLMLIRALDNKKSIKGLNNSAMLLLVVWLGFALIGLGVYKQHIYDHYYGFFFPAPFLLFAAISQKLISRARLRGVWLVSTAMLFLIYYNLVDNPLRYPPNRQLQRSVAVADKIAQAAGGENFNLAVIAERNYEDAYQYFLEKDKEPVIDIDALRADETITDQLFVICELPHDKCDPTNNPKTEVANFGWSEIKEEWEVMGVTIFKLIHSQPEDPGSSS